MTRSTAQQFRRSVIIGFAGFFVLYALVLVLSDVSIGWRINLVTYKDRQPVYHCSLGDPNVLNELGCRARAWYEGAGVE